MTHYKTWMLALVVCAVGCKTDKEGGGEAKEPVAKEAPAKDKGEPAKPDSTKPDSTKPAEADKGPAPEASDSVTEKPFDEAALTDDMKFQGKHVHGLRFSDKNGDNLVVFSKAEKDGDIKLWVNHWLIAHGESKLLRQIKQFDTCDDGDMATFFQKKSFAISDLDKNGLGEVQFAYLCEGCRTDMSPVSAKSFLLENGEKYVARGSSYFKRDGEQPSPAKLGTELKAAPKAFAEHLRSSWAEHSAE